MSHLFRNNFSHSPGAFSTHAVPLVPANSQRLHHHRVVPIEQTGSQDYVPAAELHSIKVRLGGSNTYRYQPTHAGESGIASMFTQSDKASLIPVMHMENVQNAGTCSNETVPIQKTARGQPIIDPEAEVDKLTNELMRSLETRSSALSEQTQALVDRSIPPVHGFSVQAFKSESEDFLGISPNVLEQGRFSSLNANTKGYIAPSNDANRSPTTSQTGQVSSLAKIADPFSKKNCFRCRKPLLFEENSANTPLTLKSNFSDDGATLTGALAVGLHAECFKCYLCSTQLMVNAYYHSLDRLLCPTCVRDGAVETCVNCDRPIGERIFRALGRPYHQACFICSVCNNHLDTKLFQVDAQGRLLCMDDFNRRFAPRCITCNRPIVTETNSTETRRLIVGNRNYHIGCYRNYLTDSTHPSRTALTSN